MATDKNISAFIESQVPEYLREEGPKLVSFLKAYYEWMETSGQVTEQSKNLLTNQDIDTTNLNKFYEYFRREVLVDFPQTTLADKRLVAKRIKDLYRSKGSKLSYKLLFRILYNEDIDFINPADFMLRTSDGRWTKDAFIRLGPPLSGNLDSLLGDTVTGLTSGATGKVTEVFTTIELGIEVKQLRITDIVGSFTDKEVVQNDSGVSGTIVTSIGPLADVTFDNVRTDSGGAGHQIGDTVNITSPIGSGATGTVTGTTDGAVTFDLIDGGSGYRLSDTVVSVTGGTGSGGSITVTSIINPETINTYSDSISVLANTAIGFGPTYGAAANTDTSLASANIQSSNSNTPLSSALGVVNTSVGTIGSIDVTTGSYVTNLPEVTAVDQGIANLKLGDGAGGIKGKNARIRPRFIPGSITDLDISNGGSSYSSLFEVTVENTTRSGTTNGRGTPIITGVLEDPGQYLGSKGFLSWDMRLQDSYYYQEYSYVIKSERGLQVYRDIVNDVLHPSGTKLFGAVDLTSEIDFGSVYDVESFVYVDALGASDTLTIPSTTALGDIQVNMNAGPVGEIASSVVMGTHIGGAIIDLPTALVNIESPDGTVVLSNHLVSRVVIVSTTPSAAVLTLGDVELEGINMIAFTPSTSFANDSLVLLDAALGTVYVSNTNTVGTYLGQPIEDYLPIPAASFGTSSQVLGVGTQFDNTVKGGSTIEIEDLDPAATGNTTYIVNTVFSNTALSINTPFGGGLALANGVYRYTYDGNI